MGCSSLQGSRPFIIVLIHVDKENLNIKIEDGSTVKDALAHAKIVLDELDRVEPSLATALSNGDKVSVIRVREEYYVHQESIPFDHQEIINEVLPEGERRLSQPGVNGMREVTHHRLYEDGIEVSNSIVNSTILKEAVAEIIMVGIQSSYAPINIPGRIVYLSTGNAWMMERSTSNRQLVISTGDLDGRIFTLSKNGKYLLFTRHSEDANSINSLWVVRIGTEPAKMIDLGIKNIVHFAAFDPSSTQIAYSTVEWRETVPGWQANNDLNVLSISENDEISNPTLLIDSNSGGIYGWWGTEFTWSPDGMKFLYSRPDEIGIFDIETKSMTAIYSFTPYQTIGDWAWIPPASWSPDGLSIYTISRRLSDVAIGESYQQFDLIAISLINNSLINMQENVGMFSTPTPSPVGHKEKYINSFSLGEYTQEGFSIAFTQVSVPESSDLGGYRLFIMDKDGSNRKNIFPDDGSSGFEVQQIVWSPKALEWGSSFSIALMYNGNVWLINPETGENQQVTGDGLTNRIDWR